MDLSDNYKAMCIAATPQLEWPKDMNGKHYCSVNGAMFTQNIWLPRQDELQELVRHKFEPSCYLLVRFNAFVNGNGLRDSDEISFESMWLMFYMYEKHGLMWDGKEWRSQ